MLESGSILLPTYQATQLCSNTPCHNFFIPIWILGFDKSAVSRAVTSVTDALVKLGGNKVKWPVTEREKSTIMQGFYRNGGFPHVIGAIDGTHVRIIAPTDDEPSFVNRKGYHSINVQAVCDHLGKLLSPLQLFSYIDSFNDHDLLLKMSKECSINKLGTCFRLGYPSIHFGVPNTRNNLVTCYHVVYPYNHFGAPTQEISLVILIIS